MTRKLTTAIFRKRVEDNTNNEYTLLSEYTNAKTKVLLKHNKCGNTYSVTPSDFTCGKRCPKCAVKIRSKKEAKTGKQYVAEVYKLVGNEYTVSGTYTNWKTKMTFTHNLCGNVFKMEANSFLQGRRCPICQHVVEVRKRTKTDEDFCKDVATKFGNEYKVIGTYKNNNTKITVKHVTCGNIWKIKPANLLSGYGCPLCKQSKGEIYIKQSLDQLGIPYTTQKTFNNLVDKRKLSYDFYLPELNILIEYQGIQHYRVSDFFGGKQKLIKQKKHDAMKRSYALTNGYLLLEIKYTNDTFDKVNNILKSKLKVSA